MSGGSFNYLCFVDQHDITERLSDLEDMAAALEAAGCEDGAKETLHIKYSIEHFHTRMRVRLERIQDLWKAIEWERSCDTRREDTVKAIAKYRAEIDAPAESEHGHD